MDIKLLRQQKKLLKLSYDDISKKSKIPKTTVTNILTGRTQNPRIDTLEAIERALEIKPSMTVEEPRITETRKESITPLEEEMLFAFRAVGKKHGERRQRALIDVANGMVDMK